MARSLLFVCLSACLCLSLTTLLPFTFAGIDSDARAGGPVAPPKTAAKAADEIDAPAKRAVVLRIAGTKRVSQITGRDSPNDTAARWNVYGTDLGHMFWHRGKLHMVFGDTFGPGQLTGRKNWRSNAMARIADPDPRNGFPIESMITGPDGTAKELVRSRKIDGVEKTVIPTFGISLGGRMYLHYMSVKEWGKHGSWEVNHSGIAYSDDDGSTWVTPPQAVWPQNSGFEQVAFVLHEGVLYSFGIPEGRFGGVRLRRVAPERILVPDAYEYWNGEQWTATPAGAAMLVAAPVGELSVAFSPAYRTWLMMYLDPKRRSVVLRTAPQLTGPWGDPQIVVSAGDYPGLYAPYIVPGSDIGAHLYYTMSQWDPYNVFLMRTTLEWGAVAAASAPGGSTPDEVGGTPVTSQN